MATIEAEVREKIEILKSYHFFNDFMDADLPDNQQFLDNLGAFRKDLIKKGFSKKELKLLRHLIALSTYPKEKRYTMLERWLVAELTSETISFKVVKNPFGRDLKQFYKDIYERAFPEEERESLSDYRKWMASENLLPSKIIHFFDTRIYKNAYGHGIHPRWYMLVVKVKGIVVGGAVFNTIHTKEISFMVIDYIVILLQHLNEIEELKEFTAGKYKVSMLQALFERCKYYAVKDAMRYGNKHPSFIIGRVNDPVRMYRKGILNAEHDIENPVLRLRLYSIIGFRFLDFPYVSPSMGEEKEPVDYLYEMMYPFLPQFRNELDPRVYKYVLLTYLAPWADVTTSPVTEMSAYLDDLIRQSKKIRLMNFADLGIPKEIIYRSKQIRWKVED